MKKCLLLLSMMMLLSVSLLGCGSSKKDERTLDDFIKAYTDQGIEVDKEEKPYFQLVGANDAVIFYLDNSPVKIYQYASEKDLSQAKKDYEIIKDFVSNGRFLLETSNEDVQKIFENVESEK